MCRGSKIADTLFSSTATSDKAEAYAQYCAHCLVRQECTTYGDMGKNSGRLYGDHNRPASVAEAPMATKEQARRRRREIVEVEILKRPLTDEELEAAGYVDTPPAASEMGGADREESGPRKTHAEKIAELQREHPAASMDADDWRADSPCASSGIPVEDFFKARSYKVTQRAVALCVDCPFRTECEAWGDSLGARYGVWAGEVRTPRSTSV